MIQTNFYFPFKRKNHQHNSSKHNAKRWSIYANKATFGKVEIINPIMDLNKNLMINSNMPSKKESSINSKNNSISITLKYSNRDNYHAVVL